jgi:hypothetical protein
VSGLGGAGGFGSVDPGGGVGNGFRVGSCCGVVTPGVFGVVLGFVVLGFVVLGFVVLGFVVSGFVVLGFVVLGEGVGVVGELPRSLSDEPGGFAFVGSAGAV